MCDILFQRYTLWKEDSSCMASAPVEYEKWVFYSLHMGKRILKLKIGGIPPDIRSEWLVAAVLTDSEDP